MLFCICCIWTQGLMHNQRSRKARNPFKRGINSTFTKKNTPVNICNLNTDLKTKSLERFISEMTDMISCYSQQGNISQIGLNFTQNKWFTWDSKKKTTPTVCVWSGTQCPVKMCLVILQTYMWVRGICSQKWNQPFLNRDMSSGGLVTGLSSVIPPTLNWWNWCQGTTF